MNKIIVEKMVDGWKAYRQGNHGQWGFGLSEYAAIGNLVDAHRDVFGVDIEFPEDQFPEDRPRGTTANAHPKSEKLRIDKTMTFSTTAKTPSGKTIQTVTNDTLEGVWRTEFHMRVGSYNVAIETRDQDGHLVERHTHDDETGAWLGPFEDDEIEDERMNEVTL